MIACQRVEFRYAKDSRDFRFDVCFATGKIHALMGPSGAGKSTLLYLIAGLLSPSAGDILVDGVSVVGKDPGALPVSIMFQDNNLFSHLTAFQNIALGVDGKTRVATSVRSEILDCLEHMGLSGLGNHLPSQLSGGQKQRVALARSFLRAIPRGKRHGKPYILLDEPFSSLDRDTEETIRDILLSFSERFHITLILTSHDQQTVDDFADTVTVLEENDGVTRVSEQVH